MSDSLLRQPKDILRDFARNAEILKALSAALQPYADREVELKSELIGSMKATGIKTLTDREIQWDAKFSSRNDVRILDIDAVEEELVRIGRIDEVMETTLNTTKIKAIAKEMKVLLPGMANSSTEYVTVKPTVAKTVLAPAPAPEPVEEPAAETTPAADPF